MLGVGPRYVGSGGGGGSGGTLTIGVFSDAGLTNPITSADFGDTVYINLTTSIASPTEYRFLIFESSVIGNYTLQAGATLSYTISSFNALIVFAESEDGTSVAAALTPFDLTINADTDANAFITAHNALSGQTMGATQQQVVQGIYQRLKGTGTPNGSDLWTYFRSNVNSRWLPLVPISNTTFDIDAYTLDLIWLNNAATFNGMILSDFSVNGVFGGVSKALQLDVAPSDFPLNSFAIGSYARTVIVNSPTFCAGAADSNITLNSTYMVLNRNGQARCVLNGSSATSFAYADNSQGSWLANRPSSTNEQIWRNGVLLGDRIVSSTARSTQNMYFHAANVGGTITSPWVGELSSYIMVEGLTLDQEQDVEFIQQYIQANVITGGRNV